MKKELLWFLKLVKIKKSKTIKFNCEPKLSDFKIGEIKSKISVLDRSVNSRFWYKLISFKPLKNIFVGRYWYIEMLSASDNGSIDIRYSPRKIKKMIFSLIL